MRKFIFLLFFILTIFLVSVSLYLFTGNIVIEDINITNITSSSVTISFESDIPLDGEIIVKSEDSWNLFDGFVNIGEVFYDDRTIEINDAGEYLKTISEKRYINYVTIRDLSPETEYSFRVRGNNKIFEPYISSFITKEVSDRIDTPKTLTGKIYVDNTQDYSDFIIKFNNKGIDKSTYATSDGNFLIEVSDFLNKETYFSIDLEIFNKDYYLDESFVITSQELEKIVNIGYFSPKIKTSTNTDVSVSNPACITPGQNKGLGESCDPSCDALACDGDGPLGCNFDKGEAYRCTPFPYCHNTTNCNIQTYKEGGNCPNGYVEGRQACENYNSGSGSDGDNGDDSDDDIGDGGGGGGSEGDGNSNNNSDNQTTCNTCLGQNYGQISFCPMCPGYTAPITNSCYLIDASDTCIEVNGFISECDDLDHLFNDEDECTATLQGCTVGQIPQVDATGSTTCVDSESQSSGDTGGNSDQICAGGTIVDGVCQITNPNRFSCWKMDMVDYTQECEQEYNLSNQCTDTQVFGFFEKRTCDNERRRILRGLNDYSCYSYNPDNLSADCRGIPEITECDSFYKLQYSGFDTCEENRINAISLKLEVDLERIDIGENLSDAYADELCIYKFPSDPSTCIEIPCNSTFESFLTAEQNCNNISNYDSTTNQDQPISCPTSPQVECIQYYDFRTHIGYDVSTVACMTISGREGICCPSGQLFYDSSDSSNIAENTYVCCEDLSLINENGQCTASHGINFSPFSKVSAQSYAPSPVTLDPTSLKRGVYYIEIPGFETAEFIVSQESMDILYFEDKNGDGIRQSNEEYIDPTIYEISLSKTASVTTRDIERGWNLLGFEIFSENYDTASELYDYFELQGIIISQISQYDNGNWIQYVVSRNQDGVKEAFGANFNLVPGKGYFVRSENSGTVSFIGQEYDSSVPLRFTSGWNLLSVQSAIGYTAESLMSLCTNNGITCSNVSRWVDGGGYYESYEIVQGIGFGENFNLFENDGYFVKNESGNSVIIEP